MKAALEENNARRGSAPDAPSPRRSALARFRADVAFRSLAGCHLCAHHCGVNRLHGEQGRCHAGAEARLFSAQVEVSDELELVPVYSIALSGCDLRCDFCITGAESWNARSGWVASPASVAASATAALRAGARSVMILGGEPTVHLPTALRIVAALPDWAPLIWKTNAHGTAQSRALLAGLFEIWVADYKFGNDRCALRLSRTPDYTRIIRENLRWAAPRTDLIVRHLLMPGHVDCCWAPVARWLAAELPGVKVNLRSGFWPAWRATAHPELHGPPSPGETARAEDLAAGLGLKLIR